MTIVMFCSFKILASEWMADNQGLYMFPQGNSQKIEGKVKPVLFLHGNIWVIILYYYLYIEAGWEFSWFFNIVGLQSSGRT